MGYPGKTGWNATKQRYRSIRSPGNRYFGKFFYWKNSLPFCAFIHDETKGMMNHSMELKNGYRTSDNQGILPTGMRIEISYRQVEDYQSSYDILNT
jgi:hypothetical protein